ncbi:HAD family hydrolase [Kribbella sp. NPDC050470]|uniref:HAD family hydrolase n=1 Tax=unclassified Kribbella TaxID=2644121 RepID=UPI0037A68EFB
MLNTLFFDGGQTLWDFDAMMRRALGATLEELRARYPEVAIDVDAAVADRQAVGELRGSMEQLRYAAFQRTLRRLGIPDNGLAAHLTDFYLEQRFSALDLYPEVLDSLTALRTTYKLGLLSNGNSYPDRFGLGQLFDAVVFAQDHDVAKPDRRLFDIAAATIDATADSIAMIGDSPVNDVTAAQRAGWRGIWLNRDARTCPPDCTPDAEIASLTELPAVLGQCS